MPKKVRMKKLRRLSNIDLRIDHDEIYSSEKNEIYYVYVYDRPLPMS